MPVTPPSAVNHGVPLFLEQVIETLLQEQLTPVRENNESESTPAHSEIGHAAALHGAEMLRLGFSIDQVVHNYGDVCQSVTDMAVELKAKISADEFRTLNRCLDGAIADAVTSFGSARQNVINEQAEKLHTQLNVFTDEQIRLLDIAIQSYAAIKTGNIGMNGATGTLLIHTLEELRFLAGRVVPELRLSSAKTTLPR